MRKLNHQFFSVFYEKNNNLNWFKWEVGIGKKYNRKRKKVIKVEKTGILFNWNKIKKIVKTVLNIIKLYSLDRFRLLCTLF